MAATFVAHLLMYIDLLSHSAVKNAIYSECAYLKALTRLFSTGPTKTRMSNESLGHKNVDALIALRS